MPNPFQEIRKFIAGAQEARQFGADHVELCQKLGKSKFWATNPLHAWQYGHLESEWAYIPKDLEPALLEIICDVMDENKPTPPDDWANWCAALAGRIAQNTYDTGLLAAGPAQLVAEGVPELFEDRERAIRAYQFHMSLSEEQRQKGLNFVNKYIWEPDHFEDHPNQAKLCQNYEDKVWVLIPKKYEKEIIARLQAKKDNKPPPKMSIFKRIGQAIRRGLRRLFGSRDKYKMDGLSKQMAIEDDEFKVYNTVSQKVMDVYNSLANALNESKAFIAKYGEKFYKFMLEAYEYSKETADRIYQATIQYGVDFAHQIMRFGERAIDLVNQYGDTFMHYVAQYKDEFVRLALYYKDNFIENCIKYKDDFIQLALRYKDEFVRLCLSYKDTFIEYAIQYKDTFIQLVKSQGQAFIDLVQTYGENFVALAVQYKDNFIQLVSQYGETAIQVIKQHGEKLLELIDTVKGLGEYYVQEVLKAAQWGMAYANTFVELAKTADAFVLKLVDQPEKVMQQALFKINELGDTALGQIRELAQYNADLAMKILESPNKQIEQILANMKTLGADAYARLVEIASQNLNRALEIAQMPYHLAQQALSYVVQPIYGYGQQIYDLMTWENLYYAYEQVSMQYYGQPIETQIPKVEQNTLQWVGQIFTQAADRDQPKLEEIRKFYIGVEHLQSEINQKYKQFEKDVVYLLFEKLPSMEGLTDDELKLLVVEISQAEGLRDKYKANLEKLKTDQKNWLEKHYPASDFENQPRRQAFIDACEEKASWDKIIQKLDSDISFAKNSLKDYFEENPDAQRRLEQSGDLSLQARAHDKKHTTKTHRPLTTVFKDERTRHQDANPKAQRIQDDQKENVLNKNKVPRGPS